MKAIIYKADKDKDRVRRFGELYYFDLVDDKGIILCSSPLQKNLLKITETLNKYFPDFEIVNKANPVIYNDGESCGA